MRLFIVVLVAAVAGAMNAIAGGGTLLTFPALIGLGIPPISANATSTLALWPESLASVAGYRAELRGARRWAVGLAIPSMVGGAFGGLLLLWTPERQFNAIVPWLVLSATALFIIQGPAMSAVLKHVRSDRPKPPEAQLLDRTPPWRALVYQFVVAVYGGYFGAGMGILMLAAFGLMGLTNIHRMNGLKNWVGFAANATAALVFAVTNLIRWPVALAMTGGAMVGGYVGSRTAQRMGHEWVRGAIVVIGIGSGVWMLLR